MASNENSISPFPDLLASKEEKASPEYGLQYVKAIWGTHTINILQYNQQRQRDIINRQYAEGLQSIEKYKDRKGIQNTSYLNLDYSPVNIIATTVDNMVGRLMATPYKIQCNAIDPESKSRFDAARNELYANMFLKPISDEMEKRTGTPILPPNAVVPENNEEAELHLKMNYKEEASIAMEEAFNFVFSSNMFEVDREKVLRDLIVIKRAAVHRYYDENNNIIVRREDPVDVITPYSKYDDFRNIPYIAVVKSYTIQELVAMNQGGWTDQQIYDIAKANAGKNNNPVWNWGTSYEGYYNSSNFTGTRPFYNFNIQTLEFYFIGLDVEKREFKVKKRRDGTQRMFFNKVDSGYIPVEGSEIVQKSVQNLYQGRWIINTEYIFNYKRANNVPREKINGSYSPKATLPLKIVAPGIFDMQNKSLVERMIPFEDQINLAGLAFQTMLIKAKPPGVAVDVRGLMDAAKGMGNEMKPIDIIRIYEQTGNFIYSSISEENDVINSRVITELRGGVSDAYRSLIETHQYYKQQINEVIGYNPAVDPGTPAAASALVGVQENAIIATNNSMRPIFNSHLTLIEILAKDLALMIQDSLEFDNEAFTNAIGAYATKTLEMGKKLAYVQMGIKIELMPDDKEKADIIGLMQMGIQTGSLTASDAIRIRQVMKEDVKLASQLLVYLEAKNRKNKMQESAALQQQNAQAQAMAGQAAAQAQAQAEMAKMEKEKERLALEYQLKDQFAQKEFERQMQLQALKNQGLTDVATINHDGKVTTQHISNIGKENAMNMAHDHKIRQSAFDYAMEANAQNNQQMPAEEQMEPASMAETEPQQ